MTDARKRELAHAIAGELEAVIEDRTGGWSQIVDDAFDDDDYDIFEPIKPTKRERKWALDGIRWTLLDEATGEDLLNPPTKKERP